MKKVLLGIAVVVVLFIGALAALPFLFKDEIVAQVKQAANESLTATVDFQEVSLSLFRHFPELAIGLQDLEVTGTGQFEGVKLLRCAEMDVAIDLWSALFGDQIVVNGFYLDKPVIKVYILEDGSANYDIAKPEPEGTASTTSEGGGKIRLNNYAISDGELLYDDRSLAFRTELTGLNHQGSGDLDADIYDLVMKTEVDALTVDYEGVRYLSNAHAVWDAVMNADMDNMKFTFKENDLKVNALKVLVDGWFQMPNDTDYTMDLKFASPENTFKSLLSVVPGAYTQDFDDVKAEGTAQFGGMVRGTYNDTSYPAFKIDLKVNNGNVQYPGLPLGISDIQVDASINSPSSTLNAMTINIPSFRLRIGNNPIQGYFNLKTPETNPTVDTKIAGTLNLGELSKAFPMEGVQELSGIIKADILAKASMNQIDAGQYEQVQMTGNFDIQNMNYRTTGMPTVKINHLSTSLSPQYVDLRSFDARLGKSDIRASGRIDNILAYFSTDKTMTGSLNMRSGYFDANEWMTTEPESTDTDKVPTASPEATEKVFDAWDFTIDGAIGKLVYEDYTLSDMRLQGNFTPNKMTIDDFGMKIGDSDLQANGRILNAWDYMFDDQSVSGVVNLKSDYFDLNPFMTESTPTTEEAPVESVLLVPENIDMTLNADFKRIRYTDMDLQNLDGQIIVKNSAAMLKDCTAEVLGGAFALAGEYNTQDPAKPAFNVDMMIQNMGFRDAFENFVTMKTIAPVAQYIDGRFNTTLSMSGLLGKDMIPDFGTLSAAGFLETINAVVNNLKPLQTISSRLNVSYLNKLELQNTKNWFELKDGKVTVQPFNVQMRDVAMQIGGSHGLNSEMSYQILTKTPRKALEKSSVGSAANSGLNWLSGEAAKYGVNVAQGEYINVRFDLTGTLSNPKVAVKILPSDGERTIKDEAAATAQATLDKARDSLRNVASQELDKAKQQATETAQKAIDSVKNVASQKVDEAKEKVVEEAGKVINEEVTKKVGDEAGKKAEEILKQDKTTEDVKKKLEEWNPLKKKKNN